MSKSQHIPVMLNEVIELLAVKKDAWYLDGTFGFGGHSSAILEKGGFVIGADRDESVIEQNKKTFEKEISERRLTLVNSRFSELLSNEIVKSHKYSGILFDLGVNSAQLDTAERGFSFQTDAMLDMRMDTRLGVTAKDLVNGLGRKELYDLLENNAQEHHSRAIVGALLRSRLMKPIETTRELAAIIQGAVPPRPSKGKSIHPATKTFLALRMAVNDELGEIERALPTALDLLSPSGRLVVLAFHETEDRIIKHTFKTWEEEGLGVSLTKKPMMPSEEECMNNPRSRSAKLRAFEKRKEE